MQARLNSFRLRNSFIGTQNVPMLKTMGVRTSICLSLLAVLARTAAADVDILDYIDPLIGTSDGGSWFYDLYYR